MKSKNTVKSLVKVMDILDLLSSEDAGLSLSDISERLGIPKSTAHALLSTMRDRSVIRQLQGGRYALGMKLFEYGCAVSRGFDISSVARAHLERLASETGFTAVISVYDNTSVVPFDSARSNLGVQIIPELGARMPLHATSQGKLLLSTFSDSKTENLLKEMNMTSFTPHTIVDRAKLIQELHMIRESGTSVEDGEYKIGLRSVSAPVYDRSGELRYALTVIGFFRRRDSDEFLKALKFTAAEAKRLSSALGFGNNV